MIPKALEKYDGLWKNSVSKGQSLLQQCSKKVPEEDGKICGNKTTELSHTSFVFELDEAVIHLDFKTRHQPSNLSAPTPPPVNIHKLASTCYSHFVIFFCSLLS